MVIAERDKCENLYEDGDVEKNEPARETLYIDEEQICRATYGRFVDMSNQSERDL
jgi:hypothetical protein